MIQNLYELLSSNSYPGRGILLGLTGDRKTGVVAYFIMGRSPNSRNRLFRQDGQDVAIELADHSKVTDPSLILYAPTRQHERTIIVSNGSHTDTIYDCYAAGAAMPFHTAMRQCTFEPDAPNYTPRIAGILARDMNFSLAIVKSSEGNPQADQLMFFEYEKPLPGIGRLIHTYAHDGNPLPSFSGEPQAVGLPASLLTLEEVGQFARRIWESLNQENKISLFVRTVAATGGDKLCIFNQYSEDYLVELQ